MPALGASQLFPRHGKDGHSTWHGSGLRCWRDVAAARCSRIPERRQRFPAPQGWLIPVIPVWLEPREGGCPGCSASAENPLSSFLVGLPLQPPLSPGPWCPSSPCPSLPTREAGPPLPRRKITSSTVFSAWRRRGLEFAAPEAAGHRVRVSLCPCRLGILWDWGTGSSEGRPGAWVGRRKTWWDRDGEPGWGTGGTLFSGGNWSTVSSHVQELTPQKLRRGPAASPHLQLWQQNFPPWLSPPRSTEPLLNNSGRRVPSAGAADKRAKWLRNGACPSGATSAPGGRAPLLPPGPGGDSGPAQVQAPGRRGRSGAAEATGALGIAFHGWAGWDTNPAPCAGRLERR